MKHQLWIAFLILMMNPAPAHAQTEKARSKRLDFAKTYFEVGAMAYSSFTGKRVVGNRVDAFEHPVSIHPYVSWGGFHFWGHAEFYVSLPLTQVNVGASSQSKFRLQNAVVTGARFLPWSMQKNKIRPYIGASWSASSFAQTPFPGEEQPQLTRDFRLVADLGVLYGYGSFSMRIGVSYFRENVWDYPISKTVFEEINAPEMAVNLGLIYAFDSTQKEEPETVERWNNYPQVAPLGSHASRNSDFFAALGPSSSFSLVKSAYNQQRFPFLQDQISSNGYVDIAVGYHFNKANWFTALSFRNPKFETEGYDVRQTIKKTSIAFEVNKFVVDYSGFAPYVGLNIAYDHIRYVENNVDVNKTLTFNHFEPGITIGWDIVPGKTEECLILRTNLRWYPFSSLDIDGPAFDFSQLEYNLIQAVFYPGRFFSSRN